MNVPICQMCKEPIWSFICPRCLGRDIGKWLPGNLKGAFRRFNKGFLRSFSSTISMEGLSCILCRRVRVANICPFCYMAEVYDWLRERNRGLAETIFRMLPLARDWTLDERGGVTTVGGAVPVSESELMQRDEGICEACECYSDELGHADGMWICRECESLEG
jgi:hypothetical protein